jgi:thioesterase domain-containing protein
MDRTALEKILTEQIPLAGAMGVRVLRADDESVELGSELDLNHNHLGTAFGGSLSALMILASYCRLFQMMDGQGHVLLKSSSMEFLKPVTEDLRAVSLAPTKEDREEFLRTYLKKGMARLTLQSVIVLKSGVIAARAAGEFVGRP